MRGKKWLMGFIVGLLGIFLGTIPSYGSGFSLFEGSARSNALGWAVVGRADDPSAVFFNPAGITQLPGLQVMTGATAILPDTDVETQGAGGTQTTSMDNNVFFPPHVYATYQCNSKVWLGMGLFSQFGLGSEFPENWPGRFNNYNTLVQSLTVNPNIAFKLTDKFSLAAGLDVMWFDVKIERKVAPALPLDQSLEGDSVGMGFNLAMHYKAFDWMSIGASYRSQVTQSVEGKVDFSPGFPAGGLVDQDVEGEITLPDMLFLGVAFYPVERLSVELGAVWQNWRNFENLKFELENGIISNTPKEWEDGWRLNFGVEYKALDWLDLRAGYSFDEDVIPDRNVDYIVPVDDKHYFCFGPGFHFGNWTLDLSYTYLMVEERDIDPPIPAGVLPGEFKDGNAHMVGLSVGYKF